MDSKGIVFGLMGTPIEQFDYVLPSERIAQEPVEPRDASRLLVLDRKSCAIEHKTFRNIVDELNAGDVLVMNDTKVFKARLRGHRFKKEFEVFLLRPLPDAMPGSSIWHAMIRPGKLAHEGNFIELSPDVSATVSAKREDGTVELAFPMSVEEVLGFADKRGEIPVPPYVQKAPEKFETYQTVYARETGSVAAPTAGFHFTKRLIEELRGKGVQIEFVTLHVGIGTFRPVKTTTLEEHEMHGEFVTIAPDTARRINEAKREGRRIIAVGTTTVRALEGSGVPEGGFSGDVNLFITPGFNFKIIDALITNFHLPKSTLLVLVSAFAGREHVLKAYQEAIRLGYRFYSFGDAMFIR
jgi:S-adenosylmethionine:tRNA ribosyltransferase-isomerase